MAAPPKAPEPTTTEGRNFAALIATEREMLAKRIADAPAAWISIPMWGRVFTAGRRLLGREHHGTHTSR